MLELGLLILGLGGLVLGTRFVIKGSLNIAEHFKISHLFIGLTILTIGTNLPELFVNITGAIHRLGGIETSGLIIGGTIGSSMGQIGLTLGIVGLFGALVLTKRELLRDGLMMIGSVVMFFLAGWDGSISRIEGGIFILVYLLYFLNLYREEKIHEKVKRAPSMHIRQDIFYLIVGFIVLIAFSNLVIDNAVGLAESWGITQSLVGILLVGLGTSLPELALSVEAIRKKAMRLSVGNLIGSNIFDILFALGIGSAISGFNIGKDLLQFDIPYLFIVSVIVILLFRRKMRLGKKEAVILIIIYGAYVALKLTGVV